MLTIFEKNEIEKVTNDFIEQVRDAIKNKPIKRKHASMNEMYQWMETETFEAPVNASGRLYNSVRDVVFDNGIKVVCERYIDALIFGRGPTINSGTGKVFFEIQKWMGSKGISETGGVAERITDKIHKIGSSIFLYHKGKDSGLLKDVNIDFSIDKLKKALTEKYAGQIAANIIKGIAS